MIRNKHTKYMDPLIPKCKIVIKNPIVIHLCLLAIIGKAYSILVQQKIAFWNKFGSD